MAEKSSEKKGISRRQFAKIAAVGTGALVAEAAGLGAIIAAKKRNSPFLSPEKRYPRELELYGEEGVFLISKIEEESGFIVPLPNTFSFENIFEGKGSIKNEAWSIEELETIKEISEKLPDKFKLKDKTLLCLVRGDYAGAGGVSGDPKIAGINASFVAIMAPKDWDLSEPSSEPELWKNAKEELSAVYVHELTHKMTAQDEDLLGSYAETVGWKKKGGEWVYEEDESVVFSHMQKRKHPNHEGPEEDIAVASMLYATNPDILIKGSKTDIARFWFLSTWLYEGVLYFER